MHTLQVPSTWVSPAALTEGALLHGTCGVPRGLSRAPEAGRGLLCGLCFPGTPQGTTVTAQLCSQPPWALDQPHRDRTAVLGSLSVRDGVGTLEQPTQPPPPHSQTALPWGLSKQCPWEHMSPPRAPPHAILTKEGAERLCGPRPSDAGQVAGYSRSRSPRQAGPRGDPRPWAKCISHQ